MAFKRGGEELEEFKESVRESFARVKNDMKILHAEIDFLKNQLKITQNNKKLTRQTPDKPSTDRQQTDTPPIPQPLKISEEKPPTQSSIGNRGVPTDRQQTDNRQTTDTRHILNQFSPQIQEIEQAKSKLKELFTKLTTKEFYIFSLLYTLEEEKQSFVTYKDLAKRAELSQSSIRDHINSLIFKRIPILKRKINNKEVILQISPEFKQLETLENLIRLREEVI